MLRFADAIPLERFRGEHENIDLRQRITFADRGDLSFGQSDVYDDNDDVVATLPLIVASRKSSQLALSFADSRLRNAEWQFVASGPAKEEVWGVLDDSLNHKGRVVLLVHSTDAGESWSIDSIEKPAASGEYDSFAMAANGRGRLTIYVPPAPKHRGRAGFYHFRTIDGGKTWAQPEHERDSLTPADDIPADDEPDSAPPTQSARHTPSPRTRGEGGGEGPDAFSDQTALAGGRTLPLSLTLSPRPGRGNQK